MLDLLIGPARSGKSRRGLDLFCRAVTPEKQARAMWLVPHRNLARTLKRRAAEKLGAVADFKILTLDDFARWVFHASQSGEELLSDLNRALLLEKIVEKNQDAALSEARKKTDFIPVLAKAIDELKENMKWPNGVPVSFAKSYEGATNYKKKCDRKSMAASAVRSLTKDKAFWQKEGIDRVLFYGFNSFSPLEWKLVEAIVKHVPSWFSLTAEKERHEFFAETFETINRLKSIAPVQNEEWLSPSAVKTSVRLLQFSNYDSELEWIARETVRLVRQEGIAPGEIAFISGAGGEAFWLAKQIFHRYGLSLNASSSQRLVDQPVVRRIQAIVNRAFSLKDLTPNTPLKKIYRFVTDTLQKNGEWEQLLQLPEEEARLHLGAYKQWGELLRECETLRVPYLKFQRMLPHFPFRPPQLFLQGVHYYGSEAVSLESYRVVFIGHVLESSFPKRLPLNLFRSEPLIDETSHSNKERMSFYQLITRANEKLYLSYSKLNHLGQDDLPAIYLKEWERFLPHSLLPEPEPLGISNPWFDRSKRDDIQKEMKKFFLRKEKPALTNRIILNELKERLKRGASITQFETFGKCPFLHFAQNVLRLQEEPQDQWRMVRGSIAHDILHELGADLKESSLEELQSKMTGLAERLFEKLSFPLSASKLNLEKDRLKATLASFLREEKVRLSRSGAEPKYFERDFGEEGKPVYKLTLPGGEELSFRGRIDRIDAVDEDYNVAVIDYKSGSLPQKKDMAEGINLQIVFYLDVCEKVLGLHPVQGLYLSLKDSKKSEIKTKELRERLNQMRAHLAAHAQAILSGSILAESDPEICQKCSMRFVCRTQEGGR